MVDAAKKGDAKAIDALIDWDTLERRALRGLRVPAKSLPEFARRASAAAVERGFAAQIAKAGPKDPGLVYLGAEQHAGLTWQTFRITPEAGGFEHYSLLLSSDDKNSARIVDLWALTTGEATTAVTRRMLLPVLGSDEKAVAARLTGQDQLIVQNFQSVIEMQKAGAEQRYKDALAIYDKLPLALQRERWLMIQRVSIASMLDDKTHLAAIEALHKAFPDDPATNVHLIDGYTLAKRYDEALAAVSVAEKASVKDAYFDVTRVNILFSAERYAEARKAAERAVATEPTLLAPYWQLVSLTLTERKFADTTSTLLDMHQKFGLTYQLEGVPTYGDYVASPEYPKLQKALASH
jgi:tetratricopeptide (TPR) repeat protein